jgi:succinate-semialdehyde dehydrogenase/glutarate-semialdehyde dehydrogenase
MPFESINPYTNQLLKTFSELSSDQLDRVIADSNTTYQDWRKTELDDRRDVLLRFAKLLSDRKEFLAKQITQEMGKRLQESEAEIEFCVEIIGFYANNAKCILADQPLENETGNAWISYQPLGVLLGVMPWNFPFYQVVRFAAPNLIVGNTILLKHAGNVPQCAALIETLFDESGLPTAAYTNLFIPNELVTRVIEHPSVRGVSLTGSERAGAAVAATAGKQLKKTVLELGGNDAFIVLDDANLDDAVAAAVLGRMRNAGQSCVASKRFIVVREIAEAFTEALKNRFAGLKLGDPMDPDTDLGPLSTQSAVDNLHQSVTKTINAGATVVIGGDVPELEGAFYNPTILTDVTPEMPTYDLELFGPVATIYVVDTEDEAVKLANDSSYGLGGTVFTSNIDRGVKVARQIETGMVFINKPTTSQADLPFGGIKNSGYGRELSELGMMEFVNKKLIHRPA